MKQARPVAAPSTDDGLPKRELRINLQGLSPSFDGSDLVLRVEELGREAVESISHACAQCELEDGLRDEIFKAFEDALLVKLLRDRVMR